MSRATDARPLDASARPAPWRIALRVVFVVAALALSAVVLVTTFEGLDAGAIVDALASLGDAELLALGAVWGLWLAAQGLQTAALVPDMPVRLGVIAYVAPAAVASIVPGPSDLPVRYRMLTTWGLAGGDATVAVAAGGVFSIGIKLVLPVVAAIGLVLSDSPLEGPMVTVVAIALLIGALAGAFVVVFSSEARTQRIGRVLDPVWRAGLRLLRRHERAEFGARLVAARARAVHALRERWLIATWGTLLAAGARFAVLLLAVRFCGVPSGELGWPQVFVAFALAQGLTVIPITAGEAGVSEVALIALMTAATGEAWVNEVTAGVIVYRLLTWLLIMPLGLVTLVLWRRVTRRETVGVG